MTSSVILVYSITKDCKYEYDQTCRLAFKGDKWHKERLRQIINVEKSTRDLDQSLQKVNVIEEKKKSGEEDCFRLKSKS